MAGDVVARAQAALEGVTEGPWEVEEQRDLMSGTTEYLLREIEQFRGYRNNVHCGQDRALAGFIAAARSLVPELVPELVAEVERLRGDRYDWMADELVVIADDMFSGDDGGCAPAEADRVCRS
ncbi:MAG: hypothetical protein PGN37_20550, partial [Mycobacterium kyogaense]